VQFEQDTVRFVQVLPYYCSSSSTSGLLLCYCTASHRIQRFCHCISVKVARDDIVEGAPRMLSQVNSISLALALAESMTLDQLDLNKREFVKFDTPDLTTRRCNGFHFHCTYCFTLYTYTIN